MKKYFSLENGSFVTGIPTSTSWVVMTMNDINKKQIDHSVILKFHGGKFEKICFNMLKTKYLTYLNELKEVVTIGDNGHHC